ncbi:beta-glucoside-specific PTS transporter subunit IIABC [Pectobacterium carotovorum]|uniref:beta-glucoside-specific PTS transporter subunit IIABC n=1 Tax=Pectobacterium carotovorum TaxID=554 RepID=UPI0010FD1CCE|nr:beta-glucoside-specific PTS transporter subunit IIABC [Pectobacterium carotovorum]KAA3667992.1 PTS beta-glucoside transporter subunit EIIBCA [Pectobacterium carotovorum subsp. carotovorum]UCZ77956.1 beta-glucoside-specific PTS transporter subunit IIABC [Pectobacterium carotovorum]
MDYKQTASRIIEHLGGAPNIISLFHCITRLRFSLKDVNKVDRNALENLDGVMGINLSGDQFQVIIGGKVAQVCQAIFDELPHVQINNDAESDTSGEKSKKRNPISAAFEIISGIFSPIIPAIAGAGILKGLLSLVISFGWVANTNQTYLILSAIGDGVFYFIPMVLAFSAGQKFGANPFVSVALAATLFHPTITTLLKSGQPVEFLGFGVSPVSYASSVIPIVISVWLLSYVERFISKYMPSALRMMFVPLLSLLIVAPVMLILIGPAGIFIGNSLSGGIIWLVDNMGPLAGVIVGGTLSLMIITGMHYVLVPIIINNISRLGYDPFKIIMYVANFGQAGAAFGVFLRSRNKKIKSLALSTSFSALMGVTEPAMYGVNIRFKRPFAAALIGGACGGGFALALGVKAYAYALSGIPGLPALVGPTFGWALVSLAISFTVAAVITFLIGFDDPVDKTEETNTPPAPDEGKTVPESTIQAAKDETLFAPLAGNVVPLHQLSDPVFADEVFGKGIAIVPQKGELRSPINGTVGSIFATNHAITLESSAGAEVLIHIGIDTVKLNGRHFTRHVEDEQNVSVGDLLISFDLDALRAENIDPSVIMIVTNTENYQEISVIKENAVDSREAFLKLSAVAV